MVTVKDKYTHLRAKLDHFGYHQPLSFESVELVEKLFKDFVHYKSNCTSYKLLNKELIQHCNLLKMNQEPLEKEHEHLLQENNFLSLQLIQERDHIQENFRDLKSHIVELENAYSDLELVNMQHITRIGELEEEILLQNKKMFKYGEINKFVKGNAVNPPQKLMKKKQDEGFHSEENVNSLKDISSINNYISDVCSRKLHGEIDNDFEKLKIERTKLANMLQLCKKKISSRDKEIKRLYEKVEKNLPIISNPLCTCHFLEETITFFDNGDVENSLEKSWIRCHTLMKKMISLAKYIKLLETELQTKSANSGRIFKKYSLHKCICKQIKQLLAMMNEDCFCQSDKTDLSSSINSIVGRKFQESNDTLKKNTDLKIMLSHIVNKDNRKEEVLNEEILQKKLKKQSVIEKKSEPACDFRTVVKQEIERSHKNNYIPDNCIKSAGIDDDDQIRSLQSEFENVKAERDYYCKEYHCLQDKLCKISANVYLFKQLNF